MLLLHVLLYFVNKQESTFEEKKLLKNVKCASQRTIKTRKARGERQISFFLLLFSPFLFVFVCFGEWVWCWVMGNGFQSRTHYINKQTFQYMHFASMQSTRDRRIPIEFVIWMRTMWFWHTSGSGVWVCVICLESFVHISLALIRYALSVCI